MIVISQQLFLESAPFYKKQDSAVKIVSLIAENSENQTNRKKEQFLGKTSLQVTLESKLEKILSVATSHGPLK